MGADRDAARGGRKNTKPVDPNGGHFRLYHALVHSNAWRALSWAEKGLFIVLCCKLNGGNNGTINATLSTLRIDGFNSASALARSLRALRTLGFIAMTRQGELSQGRKTCSLYRITDLPVFDHFKDKVTACAATRDWLSFVTLAEARVALEAAHVCAKRPKPGALTKNKAPVLSENHIGSLTEPSGPFIDSLREAGEAISTLSEKLVNGGENGPQSRMQPQFSATAKRAEMPPHQLLSENTSIDLPGSGRSPRTGSGVAGVRIPAVSERGSGEHSLLAQLLARTAKESPAPAPAAASPPPSTPPGWTAIGEPFQYVRKDGQTTTLQKWTRPCRTCGALFEAAAPTRGDYVGPLSSVNCKQHRQASHSIVNKRKSTDRKTKRMSS